MKTRDHDRRLAVINDDGTAGAVWSNKLGKWLELGIVGARRVLADGYHVTDAEAKALAPKADMKKLPKNLTD